jgi:transposase-like protein
MLTCPSCHSEKTVKNGHIHNGKQRFKCCGCNRQFVKNPEKITISQEKRELIDRLLLERISLAGIARHCVGRFHRLEASVEVARAVKVSERWLQTYVNNGGF